MKLFLITIFFGLLYGPSLLAQVVSTYGVVKDEQGQPITGITVMVKSSGKTTLTGKDGRFEFQSVNASDILIFTGAAYEIAEVKIARSATPLVIKLLAKSIDLDAVNVVSSGYQDIPKERATGSFVKVDNATLNQQSGTNILKRLDGVTSGLAFTTGRKNGNPQNKTNISVRGLSTINGPLDPLIVLDGFIYEGNIDNINPNDIESVNVLKDATAASIWGARAGNGVIVITSKKGRFNQKMQVSINANVIVDAKPDLHYLPYLNNDDYIKMEEFLFNQGYFTRTIRRKYLALPPSVEVFIARQAGQIGSADSATRIAELKSIDTRDQYDRYVYRQAVTQQYSMNIRGGSAINAYSFSVGYDRNINQLAASNEKLNVRLDNSFQPVKKLKIDIAAQFTSADAASGKYAYPGTVGGRRISYLRLADNNGNPVSVTNIYRDVYVDTAGAGKLLPWKFNPLEDYKHSVTNINTKELYATIGMQYQLIKSLNLDLKYQYQWQTQEQVQLNDMESFTTRDAINQLTQLNRTTGVANYIVPLGGIRIAGTGKVQSHTYRAQLNFNHAWKQNQLTAIAGTETRQASTIGESTVLYGYNADPLISVPVDFVNLYPAFLTGSYIQVNGASAPSSIINKFASVYANAAYTYRNLYTFSASARRDGSNIFGLNTNDKWKPLWSIGGAWNVAREHFYNFSPLPEVRVRATYGYSGNVDLGRSAVAIGNYYSQSSMNLPFVRINSINNPNLRWEKIGTFNIGIDFSSKKNLLSGSLEFYRKYGSDLYGTTYYDYTTYGATNLVTRNVADMRGTGIDLVLNVKLLENKIKWNSGLLLNVNTNKTTSYDATSAKQAISILTDGSQITPFIGKSLYSIAAYKWGGLDSLGNPQGYLNGQLSTNYQAILNEAKEKGLGSNVRYLGSSVPTIFGSLINTISYKSLSLTLNIAYRFGYYFQKRFYTSSGIVSGFGTTEFSLRWQKPGDEKLTDVPAFRYPVDSDRDNFYSAAEINYGKADNIRLQYINFSWNLDKMVAKKIPVTNLHLYCNISNLGILWRANKEKLDPDYPSSIRPVRSFAFGVRANF